MITVNREDRGIPYPLGGKIEHLGGAKFNQILDRVAGQTSAGFRRVLKHTLYAEAGVSAFDETHRFVIGLGEGD